MASTIPGSAAVGQPRPRENARRVLGIKVLGTGAYVPERLVRNEDLADLGCDSEWIVQRTGILERRHAGPDEATSDLAYQAMVRCLDAAGVAASEVDLIFVATMTPDHATPSTACILQARLGAIHAAAMDLNAACSGFTYALITAANFVRAGAYRRVLVVGADVMSRVINPKDVKTYPLFGDGAGAVLIGPADSGSEPAESTDEVGILAYQLGADGSGGDLLKVPACGSREPVTQAALEQERQYLQMDGRPVFKWAVRLVAESIVSLTEEAGLTLRDIALVILHQANIRIIDAAVSDLSLPAEKVFVNLDRFGNTSAASIPIALDEAVRQGRVKRGDRVLMCGFGAGLTWASCILTY
ncbi:MAG TPA: beta-ketoacyl-ACP synthase III [Pirellulaceae bacterium]|nr:beta-ketoacyl-ACP synthase III [Pirellulaceae bacterium]